jgi:DNA/RNA-binding protein KIN17
MPKAEKGSAKDIGNRIKSKGLQKLKFYCQMCEKQCRDANGFKCHLTSEPHLRQMKIFSDNAGGILDQYSKDFERIFMATLRMRHGTKQCNVNNVYQEVIADKQHIHMNSTHWTTLTEFAQYLGKTGKCVVEETERGWFVSYIERDASILARQENLKRLEQAEKFAELAQSQQMELQRIEAAKALDRAGGTVHTEATNMERTEDDQPIKVALSNVNAGKKSSRTQASAAFGDEDDENEDGENEGQPAAPKLEPPIFPRREERPSNKDRESQKRKEEAPAEEKQRSNKRSKRDVDRKDYWLYRNIMVRVISKKLADGKYFKRKAIVDKVHDKYIAEVEVLDSSADARDGGDILRLDQDDLETVIPKETGKKVRILNGRYRGEKATVETFDKKRYQATLKLLHDARILEKVPYEDFSKLV